MLGCHPLRRLGEQAGGGPGTPLGGVEARQPADPEAAGRPSGPVRHHLGDRHPCRAKDAKGYKRHRFEEAWEAYLPGQNTLRSPIGLPKRRSVANADGTGTTRDFRSVAARSATDRKTATYPTAMRVRDASTLQKPKLLRRVILTRMPTTCRASSAAAGTAASRGRTAAGTGPDTLTGYGCTPTAKPPGRTADDGAHERPHRRSTRLIGSENPAPLENYLEGYRREGYARAR